LTNILINLIEFTVVFKKNSKKGEDMKNLVKIFVVVMILSILLSACAPPPPPVTKVQLDTAEEEAIQEEEKADNLNNEMKTLEANLAEQEAELKSLQEYQKELEAGK